MDALITPAEVGCKKIRKRSSRTWGGRFRPRTSNAKLSPQLDGVASEMSYLKQGSTISLRDSLEEYYLCNPNLKRGDRLKPAARAFFRSHDVAHVVFGCDTSLAHEAIVKISSLFGTTGSFGVIAGYFLYDSLDIYRTLSVTEILSVMAKAPYLVPATIGRCLRQKRKWPWKAFDQYLDWPLSDIRRSFGIVVPQQDELP